jgi:hypothetical protein
MIKCRSYTFLTKRMVFAKHRWHTSSRWKITHIPVISSSVMTYANLVSIPAKEHNIHIWYTSPLIPEVVPMHLMLHKQRCIHYENVFMYWGRDNKTSLGLHDLGARLWPVARQTRKPYRMIGTILKQTLSWGNGSGIHITRRADTYLLTFPSVRRYRKINSRK